MTGMDFQLTTGRSHTDGYYTYRRQITVNNNALSASLNKTFPSRIAPFRLHDIKDIKQYSLVGFIQLLRYNYKDIHFNGVTNYMTLEHDKIFTTKLKPFALMLQERDVAQR